MIGVGIVGAGFFGAFHARAIGATNGMRVAAVCSDESQAAENFAREHGGTPYIEWQRLLADPAVDAVVIATPHHLHCEMAVASARAGKHVLVEKPMARTVAECTAMIEAARECGTVLMVGHILHFARASLVAREILDRGDVGRPIAASSALVKLWMEGNRRAWHLDPASGGGMLMTAGIHALDLLLWFMGGRVHAISASAGAFFHAQAADDSAMMLLRFADGRFGQVASVGYRAGVGSYGLDLICERGTLRIDFDRGVSIGCGEMWTDVPGSLEPDWMQRALAREWQAMAAAIDKGTSVPVTGEYGREVIACIEAAMVSSREWREVSVNLD